MAPDLFGGDGGVTLHGVENHALSSIGPLQPVEFGNITIAEGTIRGHKEQHYSSLPCPLRRCVGLAFAIRKRHLLPLAGVPDRRCALWRRIARHGKTHGAA